MTLFNRILRKLNLLWRINTIYNLNHKGTRIRIPTNGAMGLEHLERSETWMPDLLATLGLPPGTVFVDVGVNIGQTLMAVKRIYPQLEYIGFEPNPICVAYVHRLVEVNTWSDVVILPIGISDTSGLFQLSLFSQSKADSSASIIPGFRNEANVTNRMHVACLGGEDLHNLFQDRHISAIKIDVEGAEYSVVIGLLGIIKEHLPHIIVEVLPVYTKDNITRLKRQQQLEKVIQELGYTIHRIKKHSDGSLMHLEQTDSFGIHSDLKQCDYLLMAPRM